MNPTPASISCASLLSLHFLGAAAGCGQNKFEKEVELEKAAVKLSREAQKGGYGLITADELHALIATKAELVLVDAMPLEESFRKEHIPGARQFLFPKEEMPEWKPAECGGKSAAEYEALLGAEKARPVVVYCGFVACARSHNAAVWALKAGYKNVKRFAGGIHAWKGAGFPTESSP